jgi:O-methyltransferase
MNLTTQSPEFVKRMVVDAENLSELRAKFFAGSPFSPEEIQKVVETTPTHHLVNWGPNRLTMIPWTGVEHVHAAILDTLKRNVPGDFVETGAWRGGTCIVARSVYKEQGSDKKIFVADSFEGLPPPDTAQYPDDTGDTHYLDTNMQASLERVQDAFKAFGLLDDGVIFLKGWFKDTLPTAPIGKISILRLDGDMYGSTIDALKNLYHKLSLGGYCIIDDYYHPACRRAIMDFRRANGITEPIKKVDDNPLCEIHYWIKEKETVYADRTYPEKSFGRALAVFGDTILYYIEKGSYKFKRMLAE